MFEKVYKAYLDLNMSTKAHLILVINDDNVFLTVDQQDLLYLGVMGSIVYGALRHFEVLFREKFMEWNE